MLNTLGIQTANLKKRVSQSGRKDKDNDKGLTTCGINERTLWLGNQEGLLEALLSTGNEDLQNKE